jgi:ABC-type tungstate transport system permease subunit
LTAAALLNEYTITDRGTYFSASQSVKSQSAIYKAGTDDAEDLLLNPAHILIGEGAKNEQMADAFAQWVINDAGQAVITGFKKNGEQLYTGAPADKRVAFKL